MEAIILAGGFGTRLRSVVPNLPKPMAMVAGRPFLEILLPMLSRKGFSRVVMSLGFMSDVIIQHFGKSYLGMEIDYVIEDFPLGTGGAARLAISKCLEDHVYIFNGDTYLEIEIEDIERRWQSNHIPLILLREVSDVSRFGAIKMINNRIVGFAEKGKTGAGVINAGCYVLSNLALNQYSLNSPFSIEADYFLKNLEFIRFDGFVTHGDFIDIGVPEDYARAQTFFSRF